MFIVPSLAHTMHPAGLGAASSCAADGGRVVRRDADVERWAAGRALGIAVVPTTETLVIARGVHRTRVSGKRLAAALGRASRPDLSGATPPGQDIAAERARGGWVHQGTG